MYVYRTLNFTPGDKFVLSLSRNWNLPGDVIELLTIATHACKWRKKMKNRIRHFRRRQNLTLKELADRVGTTPQTVSRLETEVMTLSADWLERLATALGVHPTDLLEAPDRPDVPLLGVLGPQAVLTRATPDESMLFELRGDVPVAVRLSHPAGPFQAQDLLVASRLEGADMREGIGRNCLCALGDGRILLRRVIAGEGGTFTLVPLDPGGEIKYNQNVQWLAPLTLRLSYL